MFDRHANLECKFENQHFGTEEYYITTVKMNEEAVRKYIQEQQRVKSNMGLNKVKASAFLKRWPIYKGLSPSVRPPV